MTYEEGEHCVQTMKVETIGLQLSLLAELLP